MVLTRAGALLLAFSLVIQSSGCTVVGYSVGRVLDERSRVPASPSDFRVGDMVELELTDGPKVSGKITRLGAVSEPSWTLGRSRPGGLLGGENGPDTMVVPAARVKTATKARVRFRPVLAVLGAGADVLALVWIDSLSGLP